MQAAMSIVFGLCLCASFGRVESAQSAVTPVQKVVELLNGMIEKGKAEKHDEQVQFAAYKTFCEDTTADKSRAIGEANEMIDMLKADIEKYTVTAAKLADEIAEHDRDIEAWKGDKSAATKVRTLEKSDYDAMHTDYSESVDALGRAIAVLKEQAHNRAQASFAQMSNLQRLSLIPEEAKRAIDAFLQQDPDEGLAVSAPEAHGYDFQSHGVIQMLEKLLDKFTAKRTELEKTELNTKNEYEMLIQDLTSQIEEATEDKTEKAKRKANNLQAKADAEGDLTDTTTTKNADVQYLTDLTATCEQKATDFESRQELRAEELVAIQQAIDIISSGLLAGNAEKHLPSLSQTAAVGSSFSQIRASGELSGQMRAAQYLRDQAKQLDSRVLAAIASHVTADPFQKVKKMMKDLIMRLMEEANEEVEHKGWCDTELSTNEQTRKQKTDAVEMLHAEIDMLETSTTKLSEDITELTKAVAELDGAMADASKLRADEKAKNARTVADSEEALTAVGQALTVLNEFYAKAGEATALLQQQPEAPEIFDKPYRGMQAENGGVIGMLEVIQSDFARLAADTKLSESTAQKEYETFMTDSKVDKAAKSQDIQHKTAKKQDESQTLVQKKEDVEGTQKELDAALAYFDKLKPSCIDSGVSYDDRVVRRKEEIESLQQALRILNGEDIA